MGVYPFMFGSVKDFEPVAEEIIKVRLTSLRFAAWCSSFSNRKG
jgi:hypothetical protein